jgi:hypothetical protein
MIVNFAADASILLPMPMVFHSAGTSFWHKPARRARARHSPAGGEPDGGVFLCHRVINSVESGQPEPGQGHVQLCRSQVSIILVVHASVTNGDRRPGPLERPRRLWARLRLQSLVPRRRVVSRVRVTPVANEQGLAAARAEPRPPWRPGNH